MTYEEMKGKVEQYEKLHKKLKRYIGVKKDLASCVGSPYDNVGLRFSGNVGRYEAALPEEGYAALIDIYTAKIKKIELEIQGLNMGV